MNEDQNVQGEMSESCPMRTKESSSGCPINPATNMPYAEKLQETNSNVKLDTKREKSSIPRAEANENWMYPSQQMFFNALKRKGKETDPEYIKDMVDIHNFLNEGVWNEILKWEKTQHP